MIELKKCRERIDGLDCEILRLFEERMHVVKEVADYKKAHNIGICDTHRERELIEGIKGMSESGFEEYSVALFEKIMELSKLYQSRCLEDEQ